MVLAAELLRRAVSIWVARRIIEPLRRKEQRMNNTPAYEKEITNDLPTGLPSRYTAGGKTLFVAYGCALLERRTPKSYIYYIVIYIVWNSFCIFYGWELQ